MKINLENKTVLDKTQISIYTKSAAGNLIKSNQDFSGSDSYH